MASAEPVDDAADPAPTPGQLAPQRGPRDWLGLGLRGMLMGVAEVVPGVSGGTIAFVTGIYSELLHTLAHIDLAAPRHLRRLGLRAFWRDYNLGFLAVLGAGMALAIAGGARLLRHALELTPAPLWGFFFGVIAAAVLTMGRQLPLRWLLPAGAVGLALGVWVGALEPLHAEPAPWMFFVGGALAVSAWLLPAVSGSFLLLVLGLYEPVLAALTEGRLGILALLGTGCAVGLLLFARLLSWLLDHYHQPLLGALTGFMAGALTVIWPWQSGGQLQLPASYAAGGGDPLLLATLITATAGAVVVLALDRLTPPPVA